MAAAAVQPQLQKKAESSRSILNLRKASFTSEVLCAASKKGRLATALSNLFAMRSACERWSPKRPVWEEVGAQFARDRAPGLMAPPSFAHHDPEGPDLLGPLLRACALAVLRQAALKPRRGVPLIEAHVVSRELHRSPQPWHLHEHPLESLRRVELESRRKAGGLVRRRQRLQRAQGQPLWRPRGSGGGGRLAQRSDTTDGSTEREEAAVFEVPQDVFSGDSSDSGGATIGSGCSSSVQNGEVPHCLFRLLEAVVQPSEESVKNDVQEACLSECVYKCSGGARGKGGEYKDRSRCLKDCRDECLPPDDEDELVLG
ncbi:unnamed protein product [Prorocentrum cordatum]|uniref:Mitochondrial import inner membrane translocase subunit n=1 Tax=Prorocentrum cordatum TaxID=2364126 RepID=A0ABN9W568_9DINO|nr:unnamed protein product [Polarella glacialis]